MRVSRPANLILRLPRAVRFAVAGIVCWSVLIGGAAAVVAFRDKEEADARRPFPAPLVSLTPQQASAWKQFPNYRNVIPVLSYHGINTQENYLSLTRQRFAMQMLALHTAGFHTVTINQWARYVKTGSTKGLPSKPIMLTFDDGRLDSYQSADKILAKYHDTAVMFVVAAWPEARPGWALHWSELARMQKSGIWNIQEHAGTGHYHIQYNAKGRHGQYYAYQGWTDGHLEPFGAYKTRVTKDVIWGEHMLREHIPGYQQLAFAVPYSNYGQRSTNDPRIPRFFFRFLHTQFTIVADGDYLGEGKGRPSEIKGRGGRRISYRMTQGPADDLKLLSCRLRNFVRRVPIWHEYSCLQIHGRRVTSVYSE